MPSAKDLDKLDKVNYKCPVCGKSEHEPNAETVAAINEAREGKGKKLTLEELFKELGVELEFK